MSKATFRHCVYLVMTRKRRQIDKGRAVCAKRCLHGSERGVVETDQKAPRPAPTLHRLQQEPDAQQSVDWLERFATLAREHDVDPDAIFTALGGRPTLEPWSPAARAWQQQDPHAEEHPYA
jgi:hypothetical protein